MANVERRVEQSRDEPTRRFRFPEELGQQANDAAAPLEVGSQQLRQQAFPNEKERVRVGNAELPESFDFRLRFGTIRHHQFRNASYGLVEPEQQLRLEPFRQCRTRQFEQLLRVSEPEFFEQRYEGARKAQRLDRQRSDELVGVR